MQNKIINKSKISVSGDIGSGKSVICSELHNSLGWEIISIGKIQRKLASEHKMTTTEFNKYMESNPKIDDEIDGYVRELRHEKKSLILDSRLAWHFIPESFKIYLVVATSVAANRLLNDKSRISEIYIQLDEAEKSIRERKKSENERFYDQYKINFSDLSNYDLVVDTSFCTPMKAASVVTASFAKWEQNKGYAIGWLSPKNLIPTKSVTSFRDSIYEKILEEYAAKDMAEADAVDIFSHNGKFYIIDGHKRASASLLSNKDIIPANIFTENNLGHYTNIIVDKFIEHSFMSRCIYDWEDAHGISL